MRNDRQHAANRRAERFSTINRMKTLAAVESAPAAPIDNVHPAALSGVCSSLISIPSEGGDQDFFQPQTISQKQKAKGSERFAFL
jgi:hypothetical protein